MGRALKEAGAEENCYCVATCASANKWAVGIGGGWKAREAAVKVALSIAVVADTPEFDTLVEQYPGFGHFCASYGLVSATAPVAPPAKRPRWR